ncbi:MAG: YicC family protein [Acidobacteria bacterium]|nr:YicC family protein [Acidobacteriota bacterium]
MIHSMTGFGSARAEALNLSVLVEIKSVNHRYLDAHIKLPGEYQNFENVIRQKVSAAFKRGRLDAFARVDYRRENIKLDVNHNLIRAYVQMMSELKTAHSIQGDLTLEMITRLPGLVTVSASDLSPQEVELIGQKLGEATDAAVAQMKQMRIAEGQSLVADIDRRIANIGRHLETILAAAKDFVEHYRRQLIARVTELAPQLVADSGHRLETEALLYAERSDIAEETTRLRSHLDQFAGLRNLEDEIGKRMDFILQEMNREVTTILSKTSGLDELGVGIGQAAIEIKVEIEKLREQVQNIE